MYISAGRLIIRLRAYLYICMYKYILHLPVKGPYSRYISSVIQPRRHLEQRDIPELRVNNIGRWSGTAQPKPRVIFVLQPGVEG
jgi:hypothetical protein